MNPMTEPCADKKIKLLETACHEVLHGEIFFEVPTQPARDVKVVPLRQMPARKGLSQVEGQAHLLHDLANIELQAMELAFRTLVEFPKAPCKFRQSLAQIAGEEAKHLHLCIKGIDALGFRWGQWPVNTMLWQCVSAQDSLLDRVVIVHRYLEGSGLDASSILLNRLKGVSSPIITPIVEVIAHDEMEHVNFGSYWYRELCHQQGLDFEVDFNERLQRLLPRLPRRMEKIDVKARQQSGFSASEISYLQQIRELRLGQG